MLADIVMKIQKCISRIEWGTTKQKANTIAEIKKQNDLLVESEFSCIS